MKVLSLNVAGLNRADKQVGVFNLCRFYNVSMLQETKLKRKLLTPMQSKWGISDGKVFMAGLNSSRRGVMTIFHRNCNATYLYHLEDVLGQK